ncbi:MAG: hypothetical protein P9L88_03535 [Candidatus Tantalella remota]|nr:hypothetical protein [Candidatus Tantalella remota]
MKIHHTMTFAKHAKNQEGFVLILVLGVVLLITMTTIFFSTILRQDMDLIGRAKLSEQAKNVAEAGLHHAYAKLNASGFLDFNDFNGTLDTGLYKIAYSVSGGRTLIVSTGTVSGVSRTVSSEVSSNFPTALIKMFAGSNDIKARASSSSASVLIDGPIHANNDVELRAQGSGGVLTINGRVSATGIVQEGSRHNSSDNLDTRVIISGSNNDTAIVFEGEPRVTFPVFDLDKYKQEAIDAGDYYSGNKEFNNTTLTPSSGAIYVDGNVTFKGECTLNGGIIADDIDVEGELSQFYTGDRNIILATEMDISVKGGLFVEEAIVSAVRDVSTRAAGTWMDVTGCILAGRDMSFWNVQTQVTYTHKLTHPSDLGGVGGEMLIIESVTK